MPRYFFDVRRDGVTERDHDGTDLGSLTLAREEAASTVVNMITGAAPVPDFEMLVRDESDKVLFEVWVHDPPPSPRLSAALFLCGPGGGLGPLRSHFGLRLVGSRK